jgi:hypothetical protein
MTDIDILSRGNQAGQDTDTPLRGVRLSACPVPMGMLIIGARMFSSRGLGHVAVWPWNASLISQAARGAYRCVGSTSAAPRSGGDEPIPLDLPPQQMAPSCLSRAAEIAKVEMGKPAPETVEIVDVVMQIAKTARHKPGADSVEEKCSATGFDATAFTSQWGAQAHAFGWTARELFGLHPVPERPAGNYSRLSRLDDTGLIWLLRGRPVVALTETTAAIQGATAVLTYRKINKPALGPVGDSLDDWRAT